MSDDERSTRGLVHHTPKENDVRLEGLEQDVCKRPADMRDQATRKCPCPLHVAPQKEQERKVEKGKVVSATSHDATEDPPWQPAGPRGTVPLERMRRKTMLRAEKHVAPGGMKNTEWRRTAKAGLVVNELPEEGGFCRTGKS